MYVNTGTTLYVTWRSLMNPAAAAAARRPDARIGFRLLRPWNPIPEGWGRRRRRRRLALLLLSRRRRRRAAAGIVIPDSIPAAAA